MAPPPTAGLSGRLGRFLSSRLRAMGWMAGMTVEQTILARILIVAGSAEAVMGAAFALTNFLHQNIPLAFYNLATSLVGCGAIFLTWKRRLQTAVVWTSIGVTTLSFLEGYFYDNGTDILLIVFLAFVVYVVRSRTLRWLIVLAVGAEYLLVQAKHLHLCSLHAVPPSRYLVNIATGLASIIAYQTVVRTATERYRATIEGKNRELEKRHQDMRETTAFAAHDLRSPLQAMQHVLGLAMQPGVGEAQRQEILNEARESCGTMVAQVGRWLDVHAVENSLPEAAAVGDLISPLLQAVRAVKPHAARKEVRIETELPRVPMRALHHPEKLSEVLENLLANAIRFSPEGGQVRLAVRDDGDGWRIEVADRGPGVPEAERAKLFQKFFRGSLQPSEAPPGSGLGLHIARTLAEAMQGTLRYAPGEPRGSVFVLRLRK